MIMHDGHEHGAPIGAILDGLGVTLCLDPNDQMTDVLVISRVVNADTGQTALGVCHNGLDWITQAGLLAAAREMSLMHAVCGDI